MTLLRRGAAALVLAGAAVLLSACSMLSPTTSEPATGATPAPEASGGFGGNWLTIAMVVLLAVFVFFMWRSSRKRKAEAAKLQDSMRPGVEVMTSFGLYGTLVSVDEIAGTAELELNPGNVVKVHRQTLVKVVDPTATPSDAPRSVEEAMAIAEREQQARDAELGRDQAESTDEDLDEPRYGERVKDDEGDEGKGSKNP